MLLEQLLLNSMLCNKLNTKMLIRQTRFNNSWLIWQIIQDRIFKVHSFKAKVDSLCRLAWILLKERCHLLEEVLTECIKWERMRLWMNFWLMFLEEFKALNSVQIVFHDLHRRYKVCKCSKSIMVLELPNFNIQWIYQHIFNKTINSNNLRKICTSLDRIWSIKW